MDRSAPAFRVSRRILPAAGLVVASQACSLTGQAPRATAAAPLLPTSTVAANLPTEAPVLATATPQPSPAASPTAEPSAIPIAEAVVLTASGGNLNVRRGPGQAYDVVGFLLDSQASAASGRNETSTWVYLPIPDKPGVSGWLSVDSRYAGVSPSAAAIQTLAVLSVEPAKPAYLRNCTFHPMMIQPGGFILKQQTDAPENQKQVNPGTYTALDQNVADADPRTIAVKEGQTKDITKDGLDNSYTCP